VPGHRKQAGQLAPDSPNTRFPSYLVAAVPLAQSKEYVSPLGRVGAVALGDGEGLPSALA
jgi:hypothetical protein